MKTLGLIFMVLRFFPSLILAWGSTFLTWFLSPVLALPIFVTDIDGREWLVKPVRWFQSFDAPLDEWRYGTYWQSCSWLKWDFTKPTHKYLARLFWLCRNPAMGFAQDVLGWTPNPADAILWKWSGIWDSDSSNYSFKLFENKDANIFMKYGFTLKSQTFFTKVRYLRIYMGWKPHGSLNRLMLATFISPFRSWKP
jgi:hypothetical protein